MRKGFWVALILVVGLGGVLYYFSSKPNANPPAAAVPAKSPEALHTEWKTRTGEILQTFDRDGNAQAAQDALLSLRVSASDKNLHQELVFAFAAIVDGDKKGTERLSKARTAFQTEM